LCRLWRVVWSVSTGSRNVLQSGFAVLVVPHIPVPIPPNPVAEGANLAVIIATATSTPVMSVHSVTGKGQALLTALLGPVGANGDCGIQVVPSAVDLNFNSVKTSPTLGDYKAAAIGALLNGVYSAVTSFIYYRKLDGTYEVVSDAASLAIVVAQNLADLLAVTVSESFLLVDYVAWLIGKVTGIVQTSVDG
jgi:hypothetical protein